MHSIFVVYVTLAGSSYSFQCLQVQKNQDHHSTNGAAACRNPYHDIIVTVNVLHQNCAKSL